MCPVVLEMAEAEEVAEMEGDAGEAGTLGVTLQKYIVISDFVAFHFSKNVSMWYQSFFHCLL